MPSDLPPTIQVPLEDKVRLLATIVPDAIERLNAATEGELSADDIVDLFASAIALVIDNDSHVRTPRDFRMAGETAASLVTRRAKEMRAAQEAQGFSLLAAMLGQGGSIGPIN